jgi:menaquinone-9 beta-reductase
VEVTSSSFDLAVIGGGPAGASLAITAARSGAMVGLFDSSNFPRHKVCGEFISAESLHILRDLLDGRAEAASAISAAPEIAQARLFFGGNVVKASIAPPALSLPRYTLDLLLWEAAQRAGVAAVSRCEVLGVDGDGPFSLATAGGKITTQAVVACTGRWSRFSQTPLPAGPKWLGVKAHYREANPSLSTDLYFFEGGYCGVQPVSHDVVNACAMVRSDRATNLPAVFALSPELQERASRWELLMEPVSTAPLLYRTPQPTQGNVFLAGDAAGFIDPFAGDGISLALRTGRAAAECLQPFLEGRQPLPNAAQRYGELYGQQFAPLIEAAARMRGLLSWPALPRSLAFQCLRIPGVMSYVIRKTRQA